MDEVTLDRGIEIAFDALNAGRLAMLCGAGLSMASPSNLPSAAQLATEAKQRYEALHGRDRAPLSPDIEAQAEFFLERGELATVYLRTLIDSHAFAAPPNAGHVAVADMLLVRGIQIAVSTNVDSMIESAGLTLFGQIGVGIDRDTVAKLPPDTSPLLKIHGCWISDRDNTVWAPSQLTKEPLETRINEIKDWLSVQLLDRDLVIVGFFTDWDYLNTILEHALQAVRPARVLVVDPTESASLATKAPALYNLGERATSSFYHLRESGDVFLTRLRATFSRSFVRRVLHAGRQAFEEVKGIPADPAWTEPTVTDANDLWRVRRDLEGCRPNQPSRQRTPQEDPLLGLTLLQLQARGAIATGSYWLLDGRHVRVIRTPGQILHQEQARFERETPPVVAPDVIVAVGSVDLSIPSHIVRAATSPTIARGSAGRWLTHNDAVTELGL